MPLHTHDCEVIDMKNEIPLTDWDKFFLIWSGSGFWTPCYKPSIANDIEKKRLARFLDKKLPRQFFVSEISEGQRENLRIVLVGTDALRLATAYLERQSWLRESIPLPLNWQPPDPDLAILHPDTSLSRLMHVVASSITELGGGHTREQISRVLNQVTRAKSELVA